MGRKRPKGTVPLGHVPKGTVPLGAESHQKEPSTVEAESHQREPSPWGRNRKATVSMRQGG